MTQMPPRSNIEVIGEPHMEDTPKGRVTVIPARINANLRAKTIEEVQAQRRNLHMGLVQNCVKEVKRDIHHEEKTAAFAQRKALDPSTMDKHHVSKMVSSIVDECERVVERHAQKEIAWFNVDQNYDKILGEAVLLKGRAMGKLSYWMENKEVWAMDHAKRSLLASSRLHYGRLLNRFWDARDRGDLGASKDLAKRLCMEQGFITGELDDLDDNQEAPLHAAAADGAVRAVHMLVHAGADLETEDSEGNTPLMISCRGGIFDCAEVLLDAKADPNRTNNRGYSAMTLAAQSGHIRCISKLVEARADINRGDERTGFNPLMWATQNDQSACVEYLLQRGADVNVACDDGWTALFDAANSGALGPAQKLVAAGIDVNAQRRSGATPLFIACMYNAEDNSTIELVRLLLEAKAMPDGNAGVGKIPLHKAAENGRPGFVQLLLQHGADVHAAGGTHPARHPVPVFPLWPRLLSLYGVLRGVASLTRRAAGVCAMSRHACRVGCDCL